MKKQTKAQVKASKAKRQALVALSQAVKPLVEAGEFENVNSALIAHYSEAHGVSEEDWGTFKTWQEKGLAVVKGSKGSTIWGRKRKIEVKNAEIEENATDEEKETAKAMKFYPTATIFHIGQVETPKPKEDK